MEENMQHVNYTMLYYFKEVKNTTEMPKKKKKKCPGWCSSVDGALACKPKGCWFDSQSGHMPGLGARGQPYIDVSLPVFLLPFPTL